MASHFGPLVSTGRSSLEFSHILAVCILDLDAEQISLYI